MLDDLGDRHHRDIMFGREFAKFVQVGHSGAALTADFDQAADRFHAGHAEQVDGRFGVSGPAEDASILGEQGKDVSGANEVAGTAFAIGELAEGERACLGTHAGSAVAVIDRDQERRLMQRRIGVTLDDGLHLEPVGDFRNQRSAEHAGLPAAA